MLENGRDCENDDPLDRMGSGARDGEACVTKGDEERNTKVKREGESR